MICWPPSNMRGELSRIQALVADAVLGYFLRHVINSNSMAMVENM